MKTLSIVFSALAVILSDVMCAVVAYNYCNLTWSGRYEAAVLRQARLFYTQYHTF